MHLKICNYLENLDEKESELARHILAKYYMAPEKKNTD